MNDLPLPADRPEHLGAPGAAIGRRRFLGGVAAVGVGALVATSSGVAHAAVPAGAGSFHPLDAAVRVADTRMPRAHPFERVADDRVRVRIGGAHGVPGSATAAVLTLTAVNREVPNHVAVLPTGAPVTSEVSSLNLRPYDVTANLVTVKLGTDAKVDIVQRSPCHVVVDVVGYYEPVDGPVREGRFVPGASAVRVLDTRPGGVASGSFTDVDVTAQVPADASAVVVNLTAVAATGPGFFSVVPMSVTGEPTTSSLAVREAGQTSASAAIVPVATTGGKRRFRVFTLTAAKLVVDVVGWFTGPDSRASTTGLFVPIDPVRILDTRAPGQIGRLWPRWVVEARIPGEAATRASAIVTNLTLVNSRRSGYLTLSPARRPIPATSNVNCTYGGAVVPNHAISRITDRYGVQVLSSHGAHVLIDVAGWFTGRPASPQLTKYVNPPPPPIGPPWVLRVPRIGLTSTVLDGNPYSVTDSGNTWHWEGTGLLGQQAHVGLFAHRTTHGGIFRYLHLLQTGDEFTLTTEDRREFTYRVVRRDLTDWQNTNILAATRFHPGTTVSLIACTVGYDSSKSAYPDIWAPTSTRFRIVVTGELVGWREY